MIGHLLRSATFATWSNLIARSIGPLVLLPVMLTRLETAEIAFWLLLSSIAGLQSVLDLGFSSTFARMISLAAGGATSFARPHDPASRSGSDDQNAALIAKITAAMSWVYARTTLCAIAILMLAGSWALSKPIAELPDQQQGWLSWFFFLSSSAVSFYGNRYGAYLQGLNRIASWQRSQAMVGAMAVLGGLVTLLLGGGLLALVVVTQTCGMTGVIATRLLSQKAATESGIATQKTAVLDREIVSAAWTSAWRSGIGLALTSGLLQVSNLLYAQVGSSAQLASYLLGLRLIQAINQFSQAPLYSKLPELTRLWASGRHAEQILVAKRGMRRAYWVFVLAFAIVGFAAPPALEAIGSRAEFPGAALWALLGAGFLLVRYGALHLQLYSTTNHIVWHVVTAGYAAIFMTTSMIMYPVVGVFAFPLGVLAGHLGFYSWYSAKHSYRAFSLKFMEFEGATSALPLSTFFVSAVIMILLDAAGR